MRVGLVLALIAMSGCTTTRPVPEQREEPPGTGGSPLKEEGPKQLPQAVAPKESPHVPAPDASAAALPAGYHAEVILTDLTYPTSVEPDDQGNLYVAEAGYSYGDLVAPARVWRVSATGKVEVVADQLNGPINDLLWYGGRLYISHRGKVSVLDAPMKVRDLVTGLPSFGDHHNNALALGPDGKLYLGQGTATNSGVVGLDNVYPYLWLTFTPDVHDVPPRDLELRDVTYTTPDPLTVLANTGELVRFLQSAKHLVSGSEPLLVRTGAYQPFGKSAQRVKGQVKANGTILRMNPDGTGLEVYAWGMRNPFGVMWGPDGKLYVTDLAYDERGSRPIANAPDVLWTVKQGAFYGFPDFAAGVPVTDARFKSERGEAPKLLLKDPPPVEQPRLTFPLHASPGKFDFARGGTFGFPGQLFVGEIGPGTPITAPGELKSGNQVARIDLATGAMEPFFQTRPEALGPEGDEYVATAGPKMPVDVRFSPEGDALYVSDFGALSFFVAGAGPAARPIPGTGVIWRITRDGAQVKGPPANLSILAGRAAR